jgi:hypothetical protein
MFKYILKSALLLAFFTFVGCQKDSEEFIPVDNNITVNADIFGIVLDESDQPIEGASVLYKGVEILTDEYGIYKFESVKVDSKHSFMNITKDGYFEGTRTFRANHSKTIQLRTILLKKEFNQSFDSGNGGIATHNLATLTFAPNTIMNASTKELHNGTVQVAMKYLDPTLRETNESMPGDLTSVNTQNVVGTLQSYGMVYVELQSPSGEKLQIKTGETVEMAARIPSEVLASAPSEIPMWYFEDNSGLWREEGKAVRSGDSYVANVSHFSCWNYDYSLPAIVISGRVVDIDGNPLGGIHVWVSPVGEYLGGHGNADADGTFSGQAPKDLLLDFKLYNYGSGCSYSDPVFITQIGPFSVDTDLGDIVVDLALAGEEFLNVTGTFLNCDGNPVTNGFVKIDYHYFELTDGTLDASIVVCNNSPKHLVATDRDNFKSIEPIQLTSPGDNNLQPISVCELEADHISINCDALGYSEILLDSIGLFSYQNNTYKGFQGNNYTNGSNTYLYFNYQDIMAGDFVEGTYDITPEFEFGYSEEGNPNDWKNYSLVNGTVTITQGGGQGDIIKATMNMLLKDSTSGEENVFYGNIQITFL